VVVPVSVVEPSVEVWPVLDVSPVVVVPVPVVEVSEPELELPVVSVVPPVVVVVEPDVPVWPLVSVVPVVVFVGAVIVVITMLDDFVESNVRGDWLSQSRAIQLGQWRSEVTR